MNALYLHERIEKFGSIKYDDNKKTTSRLLERWHQQMPYRRKIEWFEVKLQEEGIDKATFLELVARTDFNTLAKEAKTIFSPTKTVWRKRFIGEQKDYIHNFYNPAHPEIGFLNLVLPVLMDIGKELDRRIQPIVEANPLLFESSKQVTNMLSMNLIDKLMRLINKTIVLELNISKVKNQLKGDTSEERFAYFIQQLKTKKFRDYINRDYPILVRRITEEADNWLHHSFQFVNRLAKDYVELVEKIFGDDAANVGQLQRAEFGAGDTHRGGRTVAIITFTSGKKVVYKPRPLTIDVHFQNFLAWISDKSGLDFKQMHILNREQYGWVEFMEHKTCSDTEGVKNYYRRIGGYTAILYALEATDFHYENIVANGEHPVLIDLESFFHPYFPIEGLGTNQANETTVLRTGLLPNRITLRDEESSVDISGLTDVEGQKGLMEINVTQGIGTDDVKIVKQFGHLQGSKNVPLLMGQKVVMNDDYIVAIKEGFEKIYRVFMDNKSEFRTVLTQFKEDEIRVIFRDTFVYAHLLEESTHPQILRNGMECERHFDWLWATVPDYALIRRIVKHEKQDLLRGDVPLFTTKVNSRHLWYSDDQYIENFFDGTGLELINNRLDKLTEGDLDRQLWVVEAALTTSIHVKKTALEDVQPTTFQKTSTLDFDQTKLKSRLLAEAQKVGDYLIKHAFVGETEAQWVGLKMEDDNTFRLMPMLHDLFSGASGEILFLAYLGEATGEEKYKTLAEKASNSLLFKVKHNPDTIRLLGLHTGWGSIVYLLTHLAHIWKRNDLVQEVENFYDKIDFNALFEVDKLYSLVNGSAGFAIANLKFYQAFGSQKALNLAKQAANYLLCEVKEYGDGLGWKIASNVALSGMAHGGSGFALVFDQLFKVTGDNKYSSTVQRILTYEQTLFVEEQQNWQDCRDMITRQFPDKTMCSTGWAHGAPGIGLSRLVLQNSPYLDNATIKNDLAIAQKTTLARGFSKNHNLTMGSFGSMEFLHAYGLINGDKAILEKSYTIANAYLNHIGENGWNCGMPNGLVTPGLMSGITGIGYQCLRMAMPETTPSILMTEGVIF
jgi:type 2 lantibiotic biosynthesis protein LanM